MITMMGMLYSGVSENEYTAKWRREGAGVRAGPAEKWI